MGNQSPYFAAFQILSMGNVEDKGYKGRAKQKIILTIDIFLHGEYTYYKLAET